MKSGPNALTTWGGSDRGHGQHSRTVGIVVYARCFWADIKTGHQPENAHPAVVRRSFFPGSGHPFFECSPVTWIAGVRFGRPALSGALKYGLTGSWADVPAINVGSRGAASAVYDCESRGGCVGEGSSSGARSELHVSEAASVIEAHAWQVVSKQLIRRGPPLSSVSSKSLAVCRRRSTTCALRSQ